MRLMVTRIILFNVKADPGERQDMFARRPDISRRLQQLLTGWERCRRWGDDLRGDPALRPGALTALAHPESRRRCSRTLPPSAP
jgi:hypothetical protein